MSTWNCTEKYKYDAWCIYLDAYIGILIVKGGIYDECKNK